MPTKLLKITFSGFILSLFIGFSDILTVVHETSQKTSSVRPSPLPFDSYKNFSLTEWTPLMRSVGKLNSTIMTSQSLLNVFYELSRNIALAVMASGGIGSYLTASYYPLALSAAATSLIHFGGKYALKSLYRPQINTHYQEIQEALKNPAIDPSYVTYDGTSAASLVKEGHSLLHADTFVPPYTTQKPEKEYTEKLETLQKQLPAPLAENQVISLPKAGHFIHPIHSFKAVNKNSKLPIIFDPRYDISFGGLEKLHPFDTKKYGKISAYLLQHLHLQPTQFYVPQAVSNEDMLLVHTPEYIKSLQSSFTLGLLADMPILGLLPNKLVQKVLLEPMKLATGGTILGAQLALEYGWAINLSGVYHHAKSAERVMGGFCIINDIGIAAKKILLQHPSYRILIIDLDAHQGNGNEEVATNEPHIAIFDMYNKDTWPGDYAHQARINFNYPLKAHTQDKEYLKLLLQELPRVINLVKPDLIIYNAGTDAYEKDPIGALSLTQQGIIQRDEIVFTQALSRKIPILMVLSGGYHADSYLIISKSIENLWNKLLSK